MANNYTTFSSWMGIHTNSIDKAKDIIAMIASDLENDDDSLNCDVEVEEDGVWFSSEIDGNVDHVEIIAKRLVEELAINKPFFCSWAYTCSKCRVDEFGGGAFVVQRGKRTFWCDAMNTVMKHANKK
jgi:hypothetical protein